MTRYLGANNALSELAATLLIGGTSLTVKTGEGNKFPSPGADEAFVATLYTLSPMDADAEIVKCTARTGDTFDVIVRSTEGTSAKEWLAGTKIGAFPTDLVFRSLLRQVDDSGNVLGGDGSGTDSIAVGPLSEAAGVSAIAIGKAAEAPDSGGVALGNATLTGNIGTADGDGHIAIGDGASTQVDSPSPRTGSIAIGSGATTSASNTIALGEDASATAFHALALGSDVSSSTSYTAVFGVDTSTIGVRIWEIPGDFSVGGTKSFQIDHPHPGKKDTHDLRHGAYEGPVPGGTIYRYTVTAKDGRASLELPDWFGWLNKDIDVHVSPHRHFGRAWGEVELDADKNATLQVHADADGEYKVMVLGTRDDDNVQGWIGPVKEKGLSWRGHTEDILVDEEVSEDGIIKRSRKVYRASEEGQQTQVDEGHFVERRVETVDGDMYRIPTEEATERATPEQVLSAVQRRKDVYGDDSGQRESEGDTPT